VGAEHAAVAARVLGALEGLAVLRPARAQRSWTAPTTKSPRSPSPSPAASPRYWPAHERG